ncbi:vWA domain-containing protein [Sulfobacillus thermosulfidooxidans]|uniref:vWA domain-containing protein n=1 Tax=Sulfobacillus thermosulfidooxidans TaxID=28034 RepID=UPI0003122181|nr:VWA domain-containing protein [Sulfobacillus thermosulfidooxidans]
MSDANSPLSWVTAVMAGRPRSPQHIDGPASDRFAWEEAAEHSTVIQRLIHDHQGQWPAFPALLQDVFQAFYKLQPTLREPDAVDPASAANRPYVEQILQEPTTQETRTQTPLDELASAVATIVAGQKLAEQIAAHPDLDQAMQQHIPPPPTAQGALAKAARRAVQAAGDEAHAVQNQLMQWGLDTAALQTMPPGERLTMAQTLMQPRFRQMADLIGRLRNLARARQGGALRHLRDEFYRVTQGQDLSRVLPVEWAALTDPLRQLDFGRRFLEGQLVQYDVRPIPRQGRGPVLCAIDCSGSMHGASMEWASAVGLALMDTARRQKRDFGAVFFNGDIVAEFVFPKGKAAPHDILRFAQIGAEGGTCFEPPLRWALQQLATARFKNADITVITDGASRLAPDFRTTLITQKRAWGFRIFSILIGG